MENFDKDKVLARVRKMLTLAENAAATEGERDNALRMAHATLAKYNLTLAQADASGEPSEQRLQGSEEFREYAWMRAVGQAVAELFFCFFFYTPLPQKHARYGFVGKESNVNTCIEMLRYLLKSINKEGAARALANGDTVRGTYWRSFCKGASSQVYQRCAQIARAAKEEDRGTGTSLVLASVYQSELTANLEFLKNMGMRFRDGVNRQQRARADAFHEGRAYGNSLGLNKQVSSTQTSTVKLPSA